MKHLNKYNESSFEEFKKLYKKSEYRKAANILLSGWGNDRTPIDKKEVDRINDYIEKTPKTKQAEYTKVFNGMTGTFS